MVIILLITELKFDSINFTKIKENPFESAKLEYGKSKRLFVDLDKPKKPFSNIDKSVDIVFVLNHNEAKKAIMIIGSILRLKDNFIIFLFILMVF